jgi:hypothetical protein
MQQECTSDAHVGANTGSDQLQAVTQATHTTQALNSGEVVEVVGDDGTCDVNEHPCFSPVSNLEPARLRQSLGQVEPCEAEAAQAPLSLVETKGGGGGDVKGKHVGSLGGRGGQGGGGPRDATRAEEMAERRRQTQTHTATQSRPQCTWAHALDVDDVYWLHPNRDCGHKAGSMSSLPSIPASVSSVASVMPSDGSPRRASKAGKLKDSGGSGHWPWDVRSPSWSSSPQSSHRSAALSQDPDLFSQDPDLFSQDLFDPAELEHLSPRDSLYGGGERCGGAEVVHTVRVGCEHRALEDGEGRQMIAELGAGGEFKLGQRVIRAVVTVTAGVPEDLGDALTIGSLCGDSSRPRCRKRLAGSVVCVVDSSVRPELVRGIGISLRKQYPWLAALVSTCTCAPCVAVVTVTAGAAGEESVSLACCTCVHLHVCSMCVCMCVYMRLYVRTQARDVAKLKPQTLNSSPPCHHCLKQQPPHAEPLSSKRRNHVQCSFARRARELWLARIRTSGSCQRGAKERLLRRET